MMFHPMSLASLHDLADLKSKYICCDNMIESGGQDRTRCNLYKAVLHIFHRGGLLHTGDQNIGTSEPQRLTIQRMKKKEVACYCQV